MSLGGTNIGKAELTIAMENLASAELQRLNKDVAKTGKVAEKTGKDGNAITSMLSDWRVQGAIVAGVVTKLGLELKQAFRRGGDIKDMQAAFQLLGGDVGNFTAQVRRMVSDADLMRMTNMGSQANLTAKEISQLGTAADILGDVLAMDTSEAFEAFTKAIMSGEAELLKQFGVTVQLTQNKLTNKKLLFDATIAAAEKYKDANLSANDAEIQLNASISNLTDALSILVNDSKFYQDFFKGLAESIGLVNEQINIQVGTINQTEIARYQRQMRDVKKEIDDVSASLKNALITQERDGKNFWTTRRIEKYQAQLVSLNADYAKFEKGVSLITKTESERLDVLDVTAKQQKELASQLVRSKKAAEEYAAAYKKALQEVRSPLSKEDYSSIFGDSRDYAEEQNKRIDMYIAGVEDFNAKKQEMHEKQLEWQIARSNDVANAQDAIDKAARDKKEKEEKEHLDTIQRYWNMFGSAVTDTWASLWEDIGAGKGFDNLLKSFIGMLATMVTNLGTAVLLASIAAEAVPWFFGVGGAAGIAAGAALIAFGGVLKGIAGSIGGDSRSSSGASFGGNNQYGMPGAPGEPAGNTYITIVQGLNTIEDLMRQQAELARGGQNYGY